MEDTFLRQRIALLCDTTEKSYRQISRELGHGPGYIHNIIAGNANPSLKELFNICEYFGITEYEFFSTAIHNPLLYHRAADLLTTLDEKSLVLILQMIDSLL